MNGTIKQNIGLNVMAMPKSKPPTIFTIVGCWIKQSFGVKSDPFRSVNEPSVDSKQMIDNNNNIVKMELICASL